MSEKEHYWIMKVYITGILFWQIQQFISTLVIIIAYRTPQDRGRVICTSSSSSFIKFICHQTANDSGRCTLPGVYRRLVLQVCWTSLSIIFHNWWYGRLLSYCTFHHLWQNIPARRFDVHQFTPKYSAFWACLFYVDHISALFNFFFQRRVNYSSQMCIK